MTLVVDEVNDRPIPHKVLAVSRFPANWLAKLKHCLVAPGFIDLSRENLCDTDAGAVVSDHKARLLL